MTVVARGFAAAYASVCYEVFVTANANRVDERRGVEATRTPGFVVWLTGLPCAGKSTLARALIPALSRTHPCEVLDGDVVRQHLSQELGFSRRDRDMNVQRIGFVAGLLARHGVAVVVAAVSPYRDARVAVRRSVERFVEVFVDCPLKVCEERDVKGMYARARRGQLPSFTGVDAPYEPPVSPEVVLETSAESLAECVDRVAAALRRLEYL